jgi:hypothetical protein
MSAEAYRWRCACCGEEYAGLPMDIALALPISWDDLDADARAASQLDDDFCEVRYSSSQVDRFIRCVLALPVPGIADEFHFGVWVSVSERSWNIYRSGFDSGVYGEEGCFGYLMHEIPDYEGSYLLRADVFFQPENLRPSVILQEAAHPLVAAQRHGIEVAQIERWVALSHRAG